MPEPGAIICFVEDSDIDFEMAALAARRVRPDAELRRSTTFHDAVRTLTDDKLTLIVLDINLPDGNGIDVLRRLRLLGLSESVSVVVFSTSTNPAEKQEALEAGADEFVHKPASSPEYLDAVGRIVQRWT